LGFEGLNNVRRYVVKVGTSSLTNENSRLDIGKIAYLVSELMSLKEHGRYPLLVSSGAIGAGMGKLKIIKRPESMSQLQAAAAIGQGTLMQTYEYLFDNFDQLIAQVLLTKDDFTNTERYKNLRNTLGTLHEWNVIPIINENDTVATEEIKVGDNDTLAAYVAESIDADALIILTDVNGLYTGHPEKKGSKLVRVVEEVTPEVENWASRDGKGFGGMYTKVQAAKRLADKGIATVIANALEPDVLRKVFKGETGTIFKPRVKTDG
jgi:glutamate 5-kinase